MLALYLGRTCSLLPSSFVPISDHKTRVTSLSVVESTLSLYLRTYIQRPSPSQSNEEATKDMSLRAIGSEKMESMDAEAEADANDFDNKSSKYYYYY
jgi:hypothetical protein